LGQPIVLATEENGDGTGVAADNGSPSVERKFVVVNAEGKASLRRRLRHRKKLERINIEDKLIVPQSFKDRGEIRFRINSLILYQER
jgi:hypothetical protein